MRLTAAGQVDSWSWGSLEAWGLRSPLEAAGKLPASPVLLRDKLLPPPPPLPSCHHQASPAQRPLVGHSCFSALI